MNITQANFANLDVIMMRLFEAEDRRVAKIISELNTANCREKGKTLHGFMHMGKKYIPPEYTHLTGAIARQPLPSLAFSLLDQANAFAKEVSSLETDKNQIRQVIAQLIRHAKTNQEMRDSLPDCVVSLIPELQHIPRQDVVAFLIGDNVHAVRAFEKALPKIEMYSITRLLY